MEKDNDYPIEDTFGDEIQDGDVYFVFGKDVVTEGNLQRYLIERQQVPCYRAI
ncbi:hypothetical protein D1B31_16125 [Neobacillus notoginsengisoli]|uniref:Uncharacterized protein n=1 Tax=Neobacillus notoginsengisoli TaxID=1578198 RepID=A0A417YR12_9BACI|nr:hypothetical protein [Neobacillus notoginsengisoli]RHW37294.1 hypothetical protein D1B31_16125 [Neobacillus notoginsengisoli]